MKTDWSITLHSNGIPVSYKIDTGAQYNIIPLTTLKNFDPELNLFPLNIKLSAYNSKIPVLGKCSLTLKHKKDHSVSFIVFESKSIPILGLKAHRQISKKWCFEKVLFM